MSQLQYNPTINIISIHTYHNACSNFSSIPNFLEKTSMLLYSRDSKRGILSTDTDNKVIEWHCSFSDIAFNIACIYASINFEGERKPVMVRVLLTGSIAVQSASKNCATAFLYRRI